MRVLLLNVDSRWNMAIRRLYAWHFKIGDEVEMRDLGLSGYPHNRTASVDASGFDLTYVSNIFEQNAYKVTVENCDQVIFGGIGSRDPDRRLPACVEATPPYYAPGEKISYGFITRGCIRNCWFCKVPKHEGALKKYNPVESIVRGVPGEIVKFLDNNILAYPGHMDVLRWLIERGTRCEFNQGLDFRLVNDENLDALARLNYEGEYIFAFDDPKYQPLLDQKIVQIKRYIQKPWRLKFYIYYHPDMDLRQLYERVEWCRSHECLPYVMRDQACWECEYKNFLIDYASYCNQPGFFKNWTFPEYMKKRTKNTTRQRSSIDIYGGLMN
ncbi:MAG: hypothetical protein ACI4P4_15515 [Faecousia sp.]